MTELSPDRQVALSRLLQDPDRLERAFPKIAEYLTAVEEFELRSPEEGALELSLIDQLTHDEPHNNPYWMIVSEGVSVQAGRRVITGGTPRGSARLQFAQMLLQETYAYAIPSPETLVWIAETVGDRTLIEVGAGRGYWAHQLEQVGVKIEAFDIQPPNKAPNPSFPDATGVQPVWHNVSSLDQLRFDPDAVLLLCWPPGWGDPMATDVLHAFEEQGGRHLIYIGEPRGGKTASDTFFAALSAGWELTATDPHHVSWWNSLDLVEAWTRS